MLAATLHNVNTIFALFLFCWLRCAAASVDYFAARSAAAFASADDFATP